MEPSPLTQIPPTPVPPENRVVHLPRDHYLHPDAPTEWWWHTGTLRTRDGRVFGFEINAASFPLWGFTQVSLSDIATKTHYQKTTGQLGRLPNEWAAVNPPWYVNLFNVQMEAINVPADPAQGMLVTASVVDKTKPDTLVKFTLTLKQEGPPFFVYGTGVYPYPPVDQGDPRKNNYYYSLTRLDARGSISIGNETFDVTGMTWMDHQYGMWGKNNQSKVKWFLQDMQLDNGVHLSNSVVFDEAPKLDIRTPSYVTVQYPTDKTFFVPSFVTPQAPTWRNPDTGTTFFLQFRVEIPDFNADFQVQSLMDGQSFSVPELGLDVYEGVGTTVGHFDGKTHRTGAAWIEQNPK